MRFLVLGCNGMAGHLISLYLKEHGYQVVGFAREKSNLVESITGDATDCELVKSLIREGNYNVVINCIGVLNQSAEKNKAEAVYLNAFFPHYLADLTDGTPTRIIHISTDCVFSGKRGHYTEYDLRDGMTFYDRSKALGELEDNKNLTLRQSIIGPDLKASGIGLLNWFMQQEGDIQGYTGAIWNGLTTLELVKIIEKASFERISGIYNMVPEVSISKYDLLEIINKNLRKKKVVIIPVDRKATDKSLCCTRKGFNYTIPSYEEMICELGDWIRSHKDLYLHYKL